MLCVAYSCDAIVHHDNIYTGLPLLAYEADSYLHFLGFRTPVAVQKVHASFRSVGCGDSISRYMHHAP